jgi:selenide,water dikinase
LNREAAHLAREAGVHAMTDVTGYSLLGHAHEMAHLSEVDFTIHFDALQWLPGAIDYARQGLFPGGMERNQAYFRQWIGFEDSISEINLDLLFDPQTSGGLLMAIDADGAVSVQEKLLAVGEQSSIVGEVKPGHGHIHIVP